jgi:hypothetical protein
MEILVCFQENFKKIKVETFGFQNKNKQGVCALQHE